MQNRRDRDQNKFRKHNTAPKNDRPDSKDLIIGVKPVVEAIEHEVGIEKVFMIKGGDHSDLGELAAKIREQNIPVSFVPKVKLDKLTVHTHQGVVALRSQVKYHNIIDLAKEYKEIEKNGLFLALDRITDVRNIGAISRSAVCFDVDAIIVPMQESGQINAEAVKSSAGALNLIPVCREKSLLVTLEELQALDYQIVVASEKSEQHLSDLKLQGPTVIVMGSESNGVSDKIINGADQSFKIEMSGVFDSLNVSVAAGVALYEISKQR
jgi:23S rRNA (guanosine2251-2'-O)-methyltransferase